MKTARMMALAGCVVGLCACGPQPDTPMAKQSPSEAAQQAPPVQSSSRVQVTRVGVFEDDVAYRGTRGIYVIRDSKTGKEYVGVSGVGIAETGSHYVPTGKSGYMKQDER